MKSDPVRFDWSHAAALLVVLAMHGAVLYGLSSVRVIPHSPEAAPLFVTLVTPTPTQPWPAPAPASAPVPKPTAPPRQPRPVQQEAPLPVEPPHNQLAAEAPLVSPSERTAPLPPPDPVVAAAGSGAPGVSPSPPQGSGPVTLASSDLALVCPVRTPPPYPTVSRRLGETGKVVLRIELDETGRVSAAKVITRSGYPRLDEAALATVKTWRCQPAQRDGQAVRAVALQPFDFTLEGF